MLARDARRLADAHLGAATSNVASPRVGGPKRVGRRHARRGGVPGEDRQLLLDRLERADGLAELTALGRVADGLGAGELERRRPSAPRGPARRTARPPARRGRGAAGAAAATGAPRRSRCRAAPARGSDRGATAARAPPIEATIVRPSASTTTTTCAAAAPHGTRAAVPLRRQPPSAASQAQALAAPATGAMVSGPIGTSSPAPARSHERHDGLGQRQRAPRGGRPARSHHVGVLPARRRRRPWTRGRAARSAPFSSSGPPELVGPRPALRRFEQILGDEVREDPR